MYSDNSDRSLSPALVPMYEDSPMNSQDLDLAMVIDTPPQSPIPDNSHLQSRVIQKLAKNFYIIGVIGCGSFGKVIEAKHIYDKRHDAIKCIPLDLADIRVDEIFQEAEFLASLEHVNVVRYRGSWIDDYPIEDIATADDYNSDRIDHYVHLGLLSESQGSRSRIACQPTLYFCIQMEYCKTNLEQVIKEGLVEDPARGWKIFWQIVEGLAYLHANQLIHRDLKPGNILMDDADIVKIGDLGLTTKMSRGSPVKDHYTEKDDIFDLAIVFSEMFGLTSMTIGKKHCFSESILPGPQMEEFGNDQQNCVINDKSAMPRNLLRRLLKIETRPTCAQLLESRKLLEQVPLDNTSFDRNNNTYSPIHTDAFCNKISKTKLVKSFSFSV